MNTLMQKLFARLYSQVATSVGRQRGATALEYIVLAAVIVGLLILITAVIGDNPFGDFFQRLFDTADAELDG